jgi:sortase A
MAIQPRPHSSPSNPEPTDLLQSLLEVPLASDDVQLRPITLYSAAEQRRQTLRGYLFRNWVDTLLQRAEWVLVTITVLIFGAWLLDGPVRDWWYYQNNPQALVAPQAVANTAPVASGSGGLNAAPMLLPYTTNEMALEAPANDFMAPGSAPITLPVAEAALQPNRLIIPAIGLDTSVKEVFIVDGVWEVAEYAAGFLHGTALPGESQNYGNTVLAGHAGLRGAVFAQLGSLQAGDDIYLDAGDWRYHYRVRESFNVWPNQVEILAPTSTPVLTLLTCTNWDTQRLVVLADLVGSKPSPSS